YLRTGTTTSAGGMRISKSTVTQSITYTVYRAVAGTTAALIGINRFALSSGLHMMRFSFKYDGGATDGTSSIDNAVKVANFGTANAPSAGNAQTDLSIS